MTEAPKLKALMVGSGDLVRRMSPSLKLWNIDGTLCTSLPQIREKIRNNPVDLVLADMEMPRLSGAAAIRKLKEARQDVTLVLLTSEAPAALGEFLEPGVFLCSFDDLKDGDLRKMVEKSKRTLAAPRTAVPFGGHVVLALHDPETGRLDAKRIAGYLGVSLSSLAAVTGGSVAAIHKAPAANSVQEALGPIERTISLLSEVFQSKEHIQAWLHSAHPDLDNQIPVRMILGGQANAVADMLAAALSGQPS
jgi:CheY-like chemotaxis protein